MTPVVSVKGEIYQLRLRNVESMRNIAKSATDSDDAAALRVIIWIYSIEKSKKVVLPVAVYDTWKLLAMVKLNG